MRIYDIILGKSKEKNISINTLEEKVGLGKGSICKWNKVAPSVISLKKVADELGCSIDELLREGAVECKS